MDEQTEVDADAMEDFYVALSAAIESGIDSSAHAACDLYHAALARAEAAERERDDANIEAALEQANAAAAWQRVAELEAELAAVKAATGEWRAVTESPPESGVYVGEVEDDPFSIAARYESDYDNDGDWPWSNCETGEFVPVTRWRYLPLPPQEPTP